MFRLKANKTSLYKLVGTYEAMPPMRRVTFKKAVRRRDYWLEWTDDSNVRSAAFL